MVAIKNAGKRTGEIQVGNISLVRDFVDVRDVVRAYYFLFEKGIKGEVYNICSSNGSSLESILNKIANILGLSITIKADNNLMRPGDIQKIIGSHDKITNHTGWLPEIPINKSLIDIIEYWTKKDIPHN